MEPHVYRLKWWAQLWYIAWGAFSTGIAATFIIAGIASGNWRNFWDWHAVLFCAVFPAFGYFFLALALRSRVVLEDSRLSVRGAIRESSVDIHEIVGYRVTVTRNATFWRIELRNGKHLSIMRSFKTDDAFHSFLSRLKQLDDEGVTNSLVSN